jgi:DNA-binding transcriptional LysR family regulator
LDLRQLTYLVAIGDEGGIRAAARRMHISQPQISQAVRRLEQELKVKLIYRTPRGVKLTAAGDELLAHARDILQRVGDARVALAQIAEQQTTALRIGVCPGALSAGELLAPILSGYRSARPDIAMHLEDLTYHGQSDRLLDGSVDIAIVRAPLLHPEITVVALAEEPRIVMVGTRHELAQEESVDLDDILAFPTLPIEAHDEYSDFWQLNDVRGGANHNEEIAPVRNVAEAQLALATRNVIVTSPSVLARLAPNPLTCTIPLTGASPSVIAVAHTQRPRRAVRDFVEVAQAMAERHIDLLPDGTLPS